MAEKTQAELLKESILINNENSGGTMPEEGLAKAFEFCEEYKSFLDAAKTETESVSWTIELLGRHGFQKFEPGKKYEPGDRIYLNNRGRSMLFAVIGSRPLTEGVRLVASHIDCPRIDLKARPLYEEAQLAFFKTHYYGGIRKYQWVAMPLALHGIICKKDGSILNVRIGEEPGDPVFCINDLLPHLSDEQNKRLLHEGIKGEELNALVGTLPFRTGADDKTPEKVKLNVMRLLNEKYGLVESDFYSADLALVPAFKARDVGFDRSLIGSYGHDDRVCAYTSIRASLDNLSPEFTWVNILADREETGSQGNTGMQSRFIENFICDLAAPHGITGGAVLIKSECLSADVSVAFDPNFPDTCDKRNTAYLNYGACLTKYTGSRGKSNTNEASAEFMGKVRRLFDQKNIVWQTGELGRVDLGGGGTVAMYISKLGVDVLDIGVPVLSMHSPFEIVAKTDVYNTYLGFSAFME